MGEVYHAVREAVDRDFPVWIKLDSTDVYENGLTIEDFLYYGERFSSEGMNAIEVNGMVHPSFYKGAYYREAAERLAERIDASVILTGGLRSLADMRNSEKTISMSRCCPC